MNIYAIPPLLTLICFAVLLALVVTHRRKSRIGRLFTIMCIMGIFLNLDMLYGILMRAPHRALHISRLNHLVLVFAIPVYIQFFHAYLNIHNRKWLERLAYLYAVGLMAISQSPVYLKTMQQHFFGMFARGGPLYPFFGVGGIGVTIYVLALLYRAAGQETRSTQKNRLRYVLVGFGWMGFLHGLNALPRMGISIYPPSGLSFIPLVVFAVGLFRCDLLDMGMLIRKGALYSLLTTSLTCLYALVVTLADRFLTGMRFSNTLHFPLLLFLMVALVFSPLKDRIQKIIDRTFFRHQQIYRRTLRHISRTIVSVLNPEAIGRRITQTLVDSMHLRCAAMYIRADDASGYRQLAGVGGYSPVPSSAQGALRRLLQRWTDRSEPLLRQQLMGDSTTRAPAEMLADMGHLGADALLPLRSGEKTAGFLLLGEKRSGALYVPEDIDLLETLASQCALALENAKNYRKAEELSRDLERKVEERTRQLRKALADKEQTQAQLIQSESLAAIGQLVAGTAHELNNPLATVKSLIQSTIEDLVAASPVEGIDDGMIDDLRFADHELSRARAIVTSLLGLSRQRQTFCEAVQVNEVVRGAVRILCSQNRHRHLEIAQTLETDLPIIEGNFANLGQVAVNLIQNAIQALTGSDGRIFLSTRYDARNGEIIFECADTGPGVSSTLRQDVFKPFFTTKPVGQGTGLGLYICHEIVRKHRGTLTLVNPGEQGARFVVRLPVGR
ncbi:hypothetical protein D3OALGA1CA_4102 [Olavius algarvensis associated proteobacterium Delta 3]|nr:hypothetical protein D3OALGB2SA_1016 [Olavius algarvensis associated proteobacterium Delta 3]CAB5145259.1 hypothetical protein D3OALGA1CA_4102 [Olavius algarvensis associated proteobacterium Delta 3]